MAYDTTISSMLSVALPALTNESGKAVNRYNYNPYGKGLTWQEQVSNAWKYADGYFL